MPERDKYEKIYSENLKYDTGVLYGSLCHGMKVKDYVSTLDFETTLDIGCGRGHWPAYMLSQGKKVAAIDISQSVIDQLDIPGATLKQGTMAQIPFGEEFDLVTSFEVLEHIPEGDLDASFVELKRVMKEDAIVSAAWHSDKKFGMELHVTLHPYEWWIDLLKTHFSEVETIKKDQYNAFIHLKK